MNHELVTRAALSRLPPEFPLFKRQTDLVVFGNLVSDANLGSSGVHFDNCAFPEGSGRVANCWRLIESEADRFSERALKAFGGLLHTTQDFYAHSNWIELHKSSPIPIWDQAPSSLPAGMFSGTIIQEEPKRCSDGTPGHDELNKDTDGSEEGKKKVAGGPNDGKTYFELAFGAAVDASVLQLDRFLSGVVCYRVTTRTGQSLFSGTDAEVFVVLHGAGMETGKIRLNNLGANDFERGKTDTFLVAAAGEPGELEKITIGFDVGPEAGAFPGWYLAEVVVERLDGAGSWKFKCGRWLAKDEGDGKTVVELGAG
jgi:hypothetical protein